MTGQTFSHYRLAEVLGEGGMGVVYRAEDLSLGRPVAIKFLHPSAIQTEMLRARFLREARVAASVSHPNVCTIFEVGEVPPQTPDAGTGFPPGTPYIAMEFVPGETLDAMRLRVGRLAVKDLLNIAVQIADGMQEAHARKIVHRDLKPQNVLIDALGRVKILDFGLAKPLDDSLGEHAVLTTARTHSVELTRLGGVVGTVAYMSPEQAQGKAVDSRSDLFSFGTMLYELATGQRPFSGDTPTATVAKILESDVKPLMESAPHLPPELDRIVRRCLQKNPADRYHHTGDLLFDLKELQQTISSGVVHKAASPSSRRIGLTAVASVVVAAFVISAMWLTRDRSAPAVRPATHRQITFSGDVSATALSPDGKFVAYVTGTTGGDQTVVIQELAGGRPLEVYKGRLIGEDLVWSPDGSELAFGAATATETFAKATFLIPRLGGTPRQLPGLSGFMAWSPDGTRIASTQSGQKVVTIVSKTSGQSTSVNLPGTFSFVTGLGWSPDGKSLAVTTATGDNRSTLTIVGADGGGARTVLNDSVVVMSPRWSAAGDFIYYVRGARAGSEVWKVERDFSQAPSPVPVFTGVPFGAAFSLTRDGTAMAYTRAAFSQNLWLVTTGESSGSRRGAVTQLTTGTFLDGRPALSPDGMLVAFSRRTGETSNIFVAPLGSGPARQVTFLTDADSPSWSPEGTELAFNTAVNGVARIGRVSAKGGPPRVFASSQSASSGSAGFTNLLAWAPAPTILYQRPGNRNIHALNPRTEQEIPLVEDESVGWIFGPKPSADAKRIAVYWNRPPDGTGIWILSPSDSTERRVHPGFAMPAGWSADGKWVYVLDATASVFRLLAVPADPGGSPRTLAELPWSSSFSQVVNCSTIDGRRFVCAVPKSSADVWIVENFDPHDRND